MAAKSAAVFKFRFGATVIATDGEAGDVQNVVVQPGLRTVTHVGVKLPGGVQVAVPIERVIDASADALYVQATREALLQAMPPLTGQVTTLARTTQISLGGKNLGSLTQVTINTANNTLYKLGVRRGMLGGEVLLDASAITEFSDDGRSLDFRLPTGTTPTPYRSDTDLLNDAHDALWNYARLRIDMRAVNLRAVDGEIWLSGHVSSTLNQRVASDLMLNLPGLTAIHNDLVADNDLAVQIARALSKDPRTHGQLIGVYPNLGRVFLRGRARTPEAALIATQIAVAAGGQAEVEVINQIGIDALAQFLPALAPVTGTDDVIPGGD